MKLTPREAKSQRAEFAGVRCLMCNTLHGTFFMPAGIDQQPCHDDRCVKMLCSKCPQFTCSHCGLAHCNDHKTEYSGLELCAVCFKGAQVDAIAAEVRPE